MALVRGQGGGLATQCHQDGHHLTSAAADEPLGQRLRIGLSQLAQRHVLGLSSKALVNRSSASAGCLRVLSSQPSRACQNLQGFVRLPVLRNALQQASQLRRPHHAVESDDQPAVMAERSGHARQESIHCTYPIAAVQAPASINLSRNRSTLALGTATLARLGKAAKPRRARLPATLSWTAVGSAQGRSVTSKSNSRCSSCCRSV